MFKIANIIISITITINSRHKNCVFGVSTLEFIDMLLTKIIGHGQDSHKQHIEPRLRPKGLAAPAEASPSGDDAGDDDVGDDDGDYDNEGDDAGG